MYPGYLKGIQILLVVEKPTRTGFVRLVRIANEPTSECQFQLSQMPIEILARLIPTPELPNISAKVSRRFPRKKKKFFN